MDGIARVGTGVEESLHLGTEGVLLLGLDSVCQGGGEHGGEVGEGEEWGTKLWAG